MTMAQESPSFKRYNKVLGTNVERILRVRRRSTNLRSKIEIITMAEQELPKVAPKPAAVEPQPVKSLQSQVDIVRPVAQSADAKRVISRSMGLVISYFENRLEIAIPNPETSEHAASLAQSLESMQISPGRFSTWTIDLRALRDVHPSLINSLYTLNDRLRSCGKNMSLIMEDGSQISAGRVQADNHYTDRYNIKQALL